MEVILVFNLFAVMAKFAFYSYKTLLLPFAIFETCFMELRHTLPGYSVRRTLAEFVCRIQPILIVKNFETGQIYYIDTHVAKTILGCSYTPSICTLITSHTLHHYLNEGIFNAFE